MARNGRRCVRSRRSSAARPRRCGGGSVRLNETALPLTPDLFRGPGPTGTAFARLSPDRRLRDELLGLWRPQGLAGTVERLMRDLGLAGAIRGKPVKTTVARGSTRGGAGLHLCRDLGRVRLCGLRDRPSTPHRRMAGEPHGPCKAGCPGTDTCQEARQGIWTLASGSASPEGRNGSRCCATLVNGTRLHSPVGMYVLSRFRFPIRRRFQAVPACRARPGCKRDGCDTLVAVHWNALRGDGAAPR